MSGRYRVEIDDEAERASGCGDFRLLAGARYLSRLTTTRVKSSA